MSTLATDTFSRANQVGFGTASDGTDTWSQARGAMTWAITSNKGTCNSASGGTFNVFRLGSQTAASVEILVRVNPADTSDIGCVARYQDINNFYYGVLSGGNLVIGVNNAGTFTTLRSVGFTYSAGSAYWLRFRLVSTSLSLKAWADGSGEPGSFQATITDSAISSAGGFGLGSDSSSATNTQFDSLTVTNAPELRTILDTAALKTTNTRTIPATAALKTTQARSVPTSAALLQTSQRTIGTTTALKTTSTRTVGANARLAKTRTVPCSACLSSSFVFAPNAMLLVPSGAASLIVTGGQTTLIVSSGQTTLIV